jgi:hypothetical protein
MSQNNRVASCLKFSDFLNNSHIIQILSNG